MVLIYSSLELMHNKLLMQAVASLTPQRLSALETAYNQIKRFHEAQATTDIRVETKPWCCLYTKN